MLCVVRYVGVASCLLIAGCAQTGSVFPSFLTDRFSAAREAPVAKAGCAQGQVADLTVACRELKAALSAYQASDMMAAEAKFKSAIAFYTEDDPVMTPDDVRTAWFGLAAVHDLQRRFADADKAYGHIRENFGESVRYFNNYGYSLFLRNDSDGARAQWQAGLKLEPDNTALLANIAALPK